MRTTNMIKRKFQWFVDLQTSASQVSVISVTAGGDNVKRRLLPFFTAFKYYKLGGVKIRLAPASTLPVDPTGLSLEAGENTVDPRDQFNPGLIRITNGEDFVYPENMGTDGEDMRAYETAMLDPRWFKFQLQGGCQRYATPRFWSVGQVHQDVFPDSLANLPNLSATSGVMNGLATARQYFYALTGQYSYSDYGKSSEYGLFQTGMHEKLGWLPTDACRYVKDSSGNIKHFGALANVPEIDLIKIILPKAYKTIYYYRLFIEETVYFKSPVNYMDGLNASNQFVLGPGMDRFVIPDVEHIGANYFVNIPIASGFSNNGDDSLEDD